MLWQEYIPYIISNLILAKVYFYWCLISATNKIPFCWESKSISKIMSSQKYGDLYVISYLLPTMIFCMYMQLPFHKLWFPLHLTTTLVGNILSHIIPFSKPFRKQLSYELRHFFKHHLVIIECDHFYKIVLLIMEMVVWFILVVWIVWSWLWCEYCLCFIHCCGFAC